MSLLTETEFNYFSHRVKNLIGLDLSAYKNKQLDRRLNSLLVRNKVSSLTAYAKLLESSPDHLREFQDFLTINVSEFYRNTDRFDELKNNILPEMLKKKKNLRVWSAGASFGAEIYTVAMVLEELSPRGKHRFLASDIDEASLDKAQTGEYLERDIKGLPSVYVKRFFRRKGDSYVISSQLRERVEFTRHDLLTDEYPKDMDLILCRNVVIYFTPAAKEKVFQKFADSLVPGGYLFIGSTESIFSPGSYGYKNYAPCFYEKI